MSNQKRIVENVNKIVESINDLYVLSDEHEITYFESDEIGIDIKDDVLILDVFKPVNGVEIKIALTSLLYKK